MAFCGKCGAQINEGESFCPSCSASADNETKRTPQSCAQNGIGARLAGINNTADTTSDFEKSDVENNKVMGVLAYLSWLVLIPIFAAKGSGFAKFHANQGLTLAITEIVWWIIEGILVNVLQSLLFGNMWWLCSLLTTVLGLVNLVFLALSIIGIINVVNGKAKELPVIGKFRILK